MNINSKNILPLALPAAHARVRGNYAFTSGIYGINPKTGHVPAAFFEEAQLAIDNLLVICEECGMSPKNIVRSRVFLKSKLDIDVFNHIFLTKFKKDELPAVTVLNLPNLAGPYRIQIEAFGLLDSSGIQKEVINDPDVPMPISHPYPHAVKFGNFVFTSAQYPIYTDSRLPEENFEAQIRLAIENMIRVLNFAGCEKKDIIKNLALLKDIKRFDDFNAVYSEYFQKQNKPPARSCYGVSDLYGISQIAMECVGYIGGNWETLQAENAPILPLPFCQGTKAENLIFVSGQIGHDASTKTTPKTFCGQTKFMMNNMLSIAKSGGAESKDFLKCSSFLTEIGQLDYYTQLYTTYFDGDYPPTSTFQVGGLAYDYVIEIDGIAYAEQ